MTVRSAPEAYFAGCAVVCCAGLVFASLFVMFLAFRVRRDLPHEFRPAGYIGDAERGRTLVHAYGCAGCHEISDESPRGITGPSLVHIGRRDYIAGRFPNEEIWMTQWLENPPRLKPGTSMPNLGVGRRDALDLAAYLSTLR